MINREKVIKGLECCCVPCMCFQGCPYHEVSQSVEECTSQLAVEALELLKEQETIVRCKDCKYCEYPKSEKEWCKKGHLHGNAEHWYCADGERR
jgi:hypothetical protein